MATDDTQDERQDNSFGSVVNRYDRIFGFDGLSDFIKNLPRQKVDYAIMGLVRHRENGCGQTDDDEIARQFGLSGMDDFWEIELSEPMLCRDFTWHLSRHFAKSNSSTDHIRAHIRKALRAARLAREPWFIEIPEAPPSNKLSHPYRWVSVPGEAEPVIAHVVPSDPPVDGIDLNKLLVRPREAAAWMLTSAQRRYLVPPSLAAVLSSSEREKIVQIGVERPAASSDIPTSAAPSEQVAVLDTPIATPEVSARNERISDDELNSYVASLPTHPQLFRPDVIGIVKRKFGDRSPGVNKIEGAYRDHYQKPVRPGEKRKRLAKDR